MDKTVKRIIIYVGVTFLLTWAYEFGVVWPAATGGIEGAPPVTVQLLVGGAMFFPAIGVVVTRLATREGFRGTSLIAPVSFRRTWRYWLLAWFGPTLLIVAGAALYFLANPGDFDLSMPYLTAQFEAAAAQSDVVVSADQVAAIGAAQLAVGAFLAPAINIAPTLGEEWGWRGYLLPKLSERLRIVPALLVSGIIWGLWHAPVIALGHNYGTSYPGFPVWGILAMCVFCTVIGTFLSFVTLRSGSCIPAALGHGATNGMVNAGLMFSATGGNPFVGPLPTGIVGGAAFIICAVVMTALLRRQEKRGEALLARREEVA